MHSYSETTSSSSSSSSSTVVKSAVPLRDQQTALAILLELAIQRGSLGHLLRAVLLLLGLWSGARHDADNRLHVSLSSAPLVPFLRRIHDIGGGNSESSGGKKQAAMSKWDEV